MSAAILAALLAAGPAQQPPTFGVSVEMVYLDVFVERDGKALRGLRAENFVVRDNGVAQHVRLVNLDQVPVAAILVLDVSNSVADGLAQLKEAGHSVLDGLKDGDQAALITFDYSPQLRIDLTPDVARVGWALDAVQVSGSTALYDALYAGLALPTGASRPLVVLFTDGDDNSSWLTADQVLSAAAVSDAVVEVVGLDDPRLYNWGFAAQARRESPRVRWLRKVAETTGGRYWEARSAEHLKEAFLEIVAEMTSRYVLAFEPEGVPLQGVHELDVKLKGAKGDVRARKRYIIR